MQINGQNLNQTPYTCNCNNNCNTHPAAAPTQPTPAQTNCVQNINSQPAYQIPPNTSGVHIQIYNPCVTAPGAQAPTFNTNAPCYYPPNYYTNQMGQNQNQPQCNGNKGVDNNTNSSTTNTSTTTTESSDSNKKTEKKEVVMLTDEYIKSLENFLNSQQKELRVNAAKQVYDRLKEDTSRKDDKALTALVNKMLQDPSNEVRMIALAALDGRICTGDNISVALLQNMQKSSEGYGQDAIDASNILLKMTSKTVEKDVPVDPNKKTEIKKTETKTKTKTETTKTK